MNIAEFSALVGTTSKTIYGKINNNSNLPVNEQLKTVKEKVKGREVTLIITNDEQIELYKNLYGKDTVINGEYYETVTDINSKSPVNEIQDMVNTPQSMEKQPTYAKELLTLNDYFNDRIEQKNTELMKVYNELSTVRGNYKLLEYKADREGEFLNQINSLEQQNEDLKTQYNELTLKNNNLERDKRELNEKLITFEKSKLFLTIFKWGFIVALFLIIILGIVLYINITVNRGNELQTEIKQEPGIEQVQPKPQPKPIPKTVKRK